MSDAERILELLRDLLEKAYNVEAEVGSMPTAAEALEWAIADVEAMIRSAER